MKKEEIYVEITNESERLRAIEILQNAGEEVFKESILNDLFERSFVIAFKESDNEWMRMRIIDDEAKITLDELEALLNPKKSNVEIGLLECLKQVQQHLINEYPKGTEIKISANEILISNK
jgi:hypothetical protein